VSLRHALLVTLLDGDATGYELARRFDIAAANFWHAQRAQLYAELNRMEANGLVAAETVIQTTRPNKRVFSLTDTGMEEIRRYSAEPSERISLKDELLVKITAVDIADHNALLDDIARRRASSVAQLDRYEHDRHRMLHGRDEDTFIRTTRRVGPYLTLLRGIALEQENIDWCDTATRTLTARATQTRRRIHTRTHSA
jgi:DNA-binding PadR family transcriptional regulator